MNAQERAAWYAHVNEMWRDVERMRAYLSDREMTAISDESAACRDPRDTAEIFALRMSN